jgi:SnoaL-like polyketide cyclase
VTTTRANVDELIDAWEAAWSDKDEAAFAAVCSRKVHYEDPLTSEPLEGLDELTRHAVRLWAAFPDARLEQTGERLTDRAALEGLPATNRFVVVHCIFYCEIRRNRLLRVRGFFDLYDAATQLGVLPARGTLSEKALLMLRGFGLRAGRGS